MKTLRPRQIEAIDQLRQSFGKRLTRPILMLPTGAGKTVIASAIIRFAREKNSRVAFIVPAISLINQTIEAFESEGITGIGVQQANHERTDLDQPVQVCSVQTLARRDHQHYDLVIVDEAHVRYDWVSDLARETSIPIIGLTATPWSVGLGKTFDNLIIGGTTNELIEDKTLCPFDVYAPDEPDLSGLKTKMGDYTTASMAKVMDDEPLVANIVKTWKELGTGSKTLCYAVDRAHARHLHQQFNRNGITAEYIDAYTKVSKRDEISKRFHDEDTQVVVNIGCLTTGIDWDVRCIILARPTKSEILFTQIIGRGLRTAEGKEKLIVLDHSNTHQTLGMVTDIHHDCLNTGDKPESGDSTPDKSLPKTCTKCSFVKPAGVHACPSCGFAPVMVKDVETIDGKLTKLKPSKYAHENRQSIYSQLLHYQQSKGYAKGWLSHKYKERYGVWPRNMRGFPMEPTPQILSWIKSKQIAYARGRAKGRP
jgi:DNA repair protein RadD